MIKGNCNNRSLHKAKRLQIRLWQDYMSEKFGVVKFINRQALWIR